MDHRHNPSAVRWGYGCGLLLKINNNVDKQSLMAGLRSSQHKGPKKIIRQKVLWSKKPNTHSTLCVVSWTYYKKILTNEIMITDFRIAYGSVSDQWDEITDLFFIVLSLLWENPQVYPLHPLFFMTHSSNSFAMKKSASITMTLPNRIQCHSRWVWTQSI